jgi:voltage-dependent anion channel protein 2
MPAQFADLGKKAKDLFSKKYDYKNEIKTINKAQDGLKFETGVTYGKTVVGSMKGFYKAKEYEAELQLNSCQQGDDSAKVTLNKLLDNLEVEVNASSSSTVGVAAKYEVDKFASKLEFDHSGSATGLKLQGSFGMNNFTAGVHAAVDCTNANFNLKDYNFGAEYTHGDLVAGIKTANGQKDVTVSVFQKLNSNLSWGSSVLVHPNDFSKTLSLGLEYGLSKTTTVKSMGNTSGAIAFAVEHKLSNPNVKFNIAAQYDANKAPAAAEKFGMSLVFGDY